MMFVPMVFNDREEENFVVLRSEENEEAFRILT